jgi:Na+-driven multidrug efflux pump
MAVDGVAFATIISWTFSCALGIIALIKNDSIAKINFKKLRFYSQELKEILTIGVPAGLQQALYSIANVIITSTVNTFGEYATTGVSIANTFDGILYQISVAPYHAVMPYVSQNIGNRNVKRATQAVSRGMMITVILGATFRAFSAIFSGQLSSIMSDNPEIIRFSQQKMIIISSTYFICGINEIMGASLRGMGRPMVAMVSTMIFMCAIRFVWVFLIFEPLRDSISDPLTFLYLIWPIGWILSILTLLCFFFPTVKALRAKFAPNENSVAETVA